MNLYLLEHVKQFLFIPNVLYSYRQPLGTGTRSFSETRMDDLERFMRFQMEFLSRWEGPPEQRLQLESGIYAFAAARIYRFAYGCEQHMSAERATALLEAALSQPHIRQAREYYLAHSELQPFGAFLLRKADPKVYLDQVRQGKKQHRLKKALWRLKRRILASI